MSDRDAWQGHRAMDHQPAATGVTEADVLRRYADRLAAVHGVADTRAAIEHHLRLRAAELGLVGLDIREDHVEEGVGTLRVRYAQHHLGLPVLGAGVEVSADIASASVIAVHSTLDDALQGAPEPRCTRSLDAVVADALAPFAQRYGAAVVVGVRTGYLRDTTRPPMPRRDNHTASHELLRTGVTPDGALHLVHELSIETTMPFERFRVVTDADTGGIRSIELLSIYITESGAVFLPRQVPSGQRLAGSAHATSGIPSSVSVERASLARATWSGAPAPAPFGWRAFRVCSATR